MERMKEQIAEVFAMLEAELAVAEREFKEIDSQYREMIKARERAYCKYKEAQTAFDYIDKLQKMIQEGETSDE